MKTLKTVFSIGAFIIFFSWTVQIAPADDTCMFTVTADDVTPNIVILLDNGAEMEQVIWHTDYSDSVDYTPSVGTETDVVPNGLAGGNGFFNDDGYGIAVHGGDYYLVKVLSTLELDSYTNGLSLGGGGVLGTITLPVLPSTTAVDDVIDRAATFRYSKNYLNWLFFSGLYSGDGSDLPDKSRFYYAKSAIMSVAKLTANEAYFGIYNFTASATGASNVQPLGEVVSTPLQAIPANNTLDSAFVNNVNNMATVTYSPLAEGLASVGGYYGSPSSGVVGVYCQKNFVIVVSPGISSEDQAAAAQSVPSSLSDADGDGDAGGIGEGNIKKDQTNDGINNDSDGSTDEADEAVTSAIPVNQNGSTYLDDVAYYLNTNDIVDYRDGYQNIFTYTIGFMGDEQGTLFLTNTSNNGNGNANLYDTSDPEYGKYHFSAEDPQNLSTQLLAAVTDILSRTSTFTAPVVPVTRTTSGNRIYMAFFKPVESNFWEGNVTKFGISSANEIVDANGDDATWDNGAMREEAQAYWETKHWADSTKSNYMDNQAGNGYSRNIYTYLGSSTDLTDATNAFETTNSDLTAAVLGNPSTVTAQQVIDYVRGADVLDEDSDGDVTENRGIITGDVLHSEPLVVYYTASTTMVYYGSNDGMLHAVTDSDGKEAWAFIPPDQLSRLKEMLEGSGHQYYVDSSPKAYISDLDGDGEIESGDKVILVCGARKGGTGYFALDVTNPNSPVLLWRMNQVNDAEAGTLTLTGISGTFTDGETLSGSGGGTATVNGAPVGSTLNYEDETTEFSVGAVITGGTSSATATISTITRNAPSGTDPIVVSDLGESWSEPQFGKVKLFAGDTTGINAMFIGGGYSATNTAGKAVIVANILNGAVGITFKNGGLVTDMNYSIPSTVRIIDVDDNGFIDKIYVGDMGSQIWRIGKFTDSAGDPLDFPETDEVLMNWSPHVLLEADSTHVKKFFYPPSITLEPGFDLIIAGTGDRDDACVTTSIDGIFAVRDKHTSSTWTESHMVDITDPSATPPALTSVTSDVDSNSYNDEGWYIELAAGEKVLAENTVFYKTLYLTTFTPNSDPCLPGGVGKLYALNYLTGAATTMFSSSRSLEIGGGIPSKPVMVINASGVSTMYISVGSTNPDATSESFEAGVLTIDPLAPTINFFYLWWMNL